MHPIALPATIGGPRLLMAALESYQIYYLDPQPHNIVFPAD